ncbi:TonB-dependent receptor [Phenylobacterium sp. VNQ135]|uniref:TonB-dependent receptor n=1 Tax=Phenylobacterium sp. VNQ135 TaxID=3400922 RepID=UPI003C10C68B
MTKSRYFCSGSAVAAALALGAAGQAAAQSQPANAARTIDEVVVTAQLREQSLQDVPIVVTSVNAQQLRDAGIRDIKDLTIAAPGLTVTSTSSAAITTARIRGIGTVGDNPGLESSVGVVIDGVYRPRNGVAFSDLGEPERIEVLKGPQGTLFGKNTTAGVINIMTKRPSMTFEADSEATISNYDGFGASIGVTGPIVDDKVAARLFVAARERDGYYKNTARPDINDQDFYTGRLQVLFEPTDALRVNVAMDYTRRDESCCGAVQIFNGATAAIVNALAPGGLANPTDIDAFRDYSNRSFKKKITDKGLSVQADWDTPWLDGARLTSITAYRKWRQAGGTDVDWTSADILYSPGYEDPNPGSTAFKTFTQEVRYAGSTDRLNWLVGAFYSEEDLDLHVRTVSYGTQFEPYLSALLSSQLPLFTGRPANGSTFVAGQGQDDDYHQKEQGFALFTNNSFKVTEQLELTAGPRYTWEEKDLETFWRNSDGGVGCATALARAQAIGGPVPANGALIRAGGLLGSGPYQLICATAGNPRFAQVGRNVQGLKEEKFTGTVKAAFRFNEQVLAYASYARGYKAGGFNLDRIASTVQTVPGQATAPVLDTSFAPELVDSYEIGVKNTLLNNSLLLNATVFYQDYSDFQLNAFNGLVFTVTSVPKVVSKGVDMDFLWFTPVQGLTLNGGVTYAETYYPKSTPVALGGNLPGARLSLAPLWSGSLAVSYERDLTDDLTGRIAINAKSVSSYNTGSDLNPIKNQPGFTVVNARVAIGAKDEAWSLEAWAQNLFDEVYYQVAYDAPFQPGSFNAFLGQPRTYGLTLRFSY